MQMVQQLRRKPARGMKGKYKTTSISEIATSQLETAISEILLEHTGGVTLRFNSGTHCCITLCHLRRAASRPVQGMMHDLFFSYRMYLQASSCGN